MYEVLTGACLPGRPAAVPAVCRPLRADLQLGPAGPLPTSA